MLHILKSTGKSMILNQIISEMKQAGRLAILPHVMCDGDSLGSCIALALALKKAGIEAKIYLEEKIADIYGFIPGKELVEVYSGYAPHYDLVVALDTGDMDRLGTRAELFRAASVTANIDHHTTNTEFAAYNYIDTKSSAVGEIVYQIIKLMGLALDKDISTCLYVAITTDTGGFRYSNTTALTHHIAGDLIENGANTADISQKVFETTTLSKVKAMSIAINSLELLENGKLALMTLTDEDVRKIGAKDEDCDGIVNIGRNIEGVEVSLLLRRKSGGEIKGNLRSKNYADVSAIAARFSGGGHKRASGFTVKKDFDEFKETVIQSIREVL